jgi:hypothetical protein
MDKGLAALWGDDPPKSPLKRGTFLNLQEVYFGGPI